MYITSDEEIKKIMFQLESDPSIISPNIKGTPVYSLCRFFIESLIRERLFKAISANEKESLAHDTKVFKVLIKPIYKKIRSIAGKIRVIYNNYWQADIGTRYRNQFDNPQNSLPNDFLFVATSALHNSLYESAELEDLVDHFSAKGKRIYFVQPNYNTKIVRGNKFDKYFTLDFYKSYSFDAGESKAVRSFVEALSTRVHVFKELDFKTFAYVVFNQLRCADQLSIILREVKPRFLFARSLYTDPWVILACRINNVRCIEIQHGVFLNDNIYYYALNEKIWDKLLLPDYIGCIGTEWLKILREQARHWTDLNSFVIGDKNSSKLKSHKGEKNNNKRKVLVAFQPSYNQALAIHEDIESFFSVYQEESFEGMEFIFRFHPLDANRKNNEFVKNVPFPITISDSTRKNIYEELSSVDILIAATSMTIYQALNIGVKVISFERFRKLTIEKGITFVSNAEELFSAILDPNSARESYDYMSELNFDFVNNLN